MQVSATVKVNIEPLKKYAAVLEADLRRSSNGPVRAAFKQWAVRYRSFIQERYDKFSKGGGDWAPLAPSTIARRRKGKGSGKPSILRDTNTLFTALAPQFIGKPGALQTDIPYGIKVGYGGPGRHPSGTATIAEIASFHQHGGPFLPKRELIVPPDEKVTKQMAEDMERALKKLSKDVDAD